jgi:hypothetical protein
MSIVESAIQNYINHYGRINRKDLMNFFGYNKKYISDHRNVINKAIKKFNLKKPFCVSFKKMAQDQAEIIKIFKDWKNGRLNKKF